MRPSHGIALCSLLLTVACSAPSPTVEDGYVETAVSQGGARALALAKARQLDKPVTVQIGGQDSFGNHTETPSLVFRWKPEEVAKLNLNGATQYTMIDLSTVEITDRLGIQAVASWCSEGEGGPVLTPRFCQTTYFDAVAAFMKAS